MACRGVFFALTDAEVQQLLSCKDDAEVVSYIQDGIEAEWDETRLLEVDKSWDAIHRCLTDGGLHTDSRQPLALCILGGRQMHRGKNYIVAFKDEEEVRQIAAALSAITPEFIRGRFATIAASGYEGPADAKDLQYTADYFRDVQEFYEKAAALNRAVIFTVDQ